MNKFKFQPIERIDRAEEKRVELHLHTKMSKMDGLISPEEAIETAKKWGHSAIAITDHGNVQAFPEAMLASERHGIKVIYGMEAYVVNDMESAIEGSYNGDFNDEIIVFDIETTGLSRVQDKIIEISAVKICGGAITERYRALVNPEREIPEQISRLTSITSDKVKSERTISEVLPEFKRFVGERLTVVNNADFCIGFIREAVRNTGLPFANPYLKLTALSRFLNNRQKSHRISRLMELYKIENDDSYSEAEKTALVFLKMIEELHKRGIENFTELKEITQKETDWRKLRRYHQNILVKNKVGLKNLYQLVSQSNMLYYHRTPCILKSALERHRDGLLIGSACDVGELYQALLKKNKDEQEVEEIVSFYDFLEIQPIANNKWTIKSGLAESETDLQNINRRIVEMGEKYNKPVVATGDVHFLNPEDEICRKIYLHSQKFYDFYEESPLYLRTTEEMLEEFSYLGERRAYEVVVKNTNLINDMIETVRPIPKGFFYPTIADADKELEQLCINQARKIYGDNLPQFVKERLDEELAAILKNGSSIYFIIAKRLIDRAKKTGSHAGSRGIVGSSLVAYFAGISDINPLPAHYLCPNCQHSQLVINSSLDSGYELPCAPCLRCGSDMRGDGQNIPHQTLLGFRGDRLPDISLNFSYEAKEKLLDFAEELFGKENVYGAGTVAKIAERTARELVTKYLQDRQISVSKEDEEMLVNKCLGVKRTTGIYPGAIFILPKEYDVWDFTPVQDFGIGSNFKKTHFPFHYLSDALFKIDVLGSADLTKYNLLEELSCTKIAEIPLNDSRVYELFERADTLGLTEFETPFVQGILLDTKPKTLFELVQISGLIHSTNGWDNNAESLIKNGICNLSDVIGTRDEIMHEMIKCGLDKETAFYIMERVRKGKGLSSEAESQMRAAGVPEWYVDSCKKIKYLFPKAHAVSCVLSALRLGWYKVHTPTEFYCATFTVDCYDFDLDFAMMDEVCIMKEISAMEKSEKQHSCDKRIRLSTLRLIYECKKRGISLLPVDLQKSHTYKFLPENGNIRLPLSVLPGFGEASVSRIAKAREQARFSSVEDLKTRAGLTNQQIEILIAHNVLDGLNETEQISIF